MKPVTTGISRRHIQAIIKITHCVGEGVGVRLKPVGEHLPALCIQGRPGGTIIRALKLPRGRVALRHVIRAYNLILVDGLGGRQLILQVGKTPVAPFGGSVAVERLGRVLSRTTAVRIRRRRAVGCEVGIGISKLIHIRTIAE